MVLLCSLGPLSSDQPGSHQEVRTGAERKQAVSQKGWWHWLEFGKATSALAVYWLALCPKPHTSQVTGVILTEEGEST